MRALQIAATGMSAQQMRVEVISNNLANMNTTGYNARRADFADLHYQQMTRAGTINAADGTVLPTGVQLGLGVRPSAVSVNVAAGRRLRRTGGDLDLAIEGAAISRSRCPRACSAYTRDGGAEAHRRRADRDLRRLSGGARHHHPRRCAIDLDQRRRRGLRLFQRPGRAGASGPVHARRVSPTTRGSRRSARTCSSRPTPPGPPIVGDSGRGRARHACGRAISRKARSMPVREITELIEAQRGYELNAKVITAADQMLGATTQVR